MHAFVHPLLLWGLRPSRRRRVDPPDQHAASSAGGVGGHGVPPGQPAEAPHLDHPQATSPALAADHRRGGRGAHGRPARAAQPVGQPAGHDARRITSCCWTTASRCRTAGATPARLPRPRRWWSGSAPRLPGRRSRRASTLLRLSRVDRPGRGTQADLVNQPVGPDFTAKLAEKLRAIEVSQTAAEPRPALDAAGLPAARRRGGAADRLPDFRLPHPAMGQADGVEEAAGAARAKRGRNCG